MTKTRVDSAESTESSEDDSQTASKGCSHISKAVMINVLRKQFQGSNFKIVPSPNSFRSRAIPPTTVKPHNSDVKGCKECKMSGTIKKGDDTWICLRCGTVACGDPSDTSSHIIKHFSLPRSDPHVVAVNVENWTCWCYKCNSAVDSNSTKLLQQATEFLKKNFRPSSLVEEATTNGTSALTNGTKDEKPGEPERSYDKSHKEFNCVKGLANLGNTCFFNSVVQCLAHTPGLPTLLSESQEGEKFSLPGFPADKEKPALPPLEGTLEPPGFVTKELARTFEQMQEGSQASTVNPKSLLNALNQKAPHLAGTGDQEDSHELLRTLMESVRSEELRRYQGQILDAIGVSRKDDPANVDEAKKYMGKVYSNMASKLYLRPDHLFQGQLISILQCQECLTTSCVPETFLDISLPVVSQRQPPFVRCQSKTPADAESPSKDVPSKHQLKKARNSSRRGKGKKAKANQQKHNNEVDDADVEDNESQEKSVETDSASNQKDDSDEAVDGDEEESGDEKEDEGKENGKKSSENLANGDADGEKSSSDEKNCIDELEQLKLSDNETGACALADPETPKEGRDSVGRDNHSAEDDDNSRWSTTMMPRITNCDAKCDSTLNTCLNQFVAIELLTGNNKVGCETCTKRAGKSAGGKTVCTNFTKQLLISAPPAILTLHLKRFEVCGARFRKVIKIVTFPLILNLASFCSVKCLGLPTMRRNQTKVLYSLYGVVVHHGGLSGGHYVAYVKAQKPPSADDIRKRFMLSNNANQGLNAEEWNDDETPEPPAGK
ncbi:Hypothetical predicted protein [Cloeon dipterum]|uniref:Ubiquitin carboxyl-terminal hydrolase n=1 Tax=Cloeon dipterum TaxID=197152 RepID=A0A8S1D4P2_9INSE|nr:Hypothetical predicted protein [Cloeon dipterum]